VYLSAGCVRPVYVLPGAPAYLFNVHCRLSFFHPFAYHVICNSRYIASGNPNLIYYPMNTTAQKLKQFFSKPSVYVTALLVAGLTAYFVVSKASSDRQTRINPAFARYISAYTSGTISKESAIRVQLAGNFGDSSKVGTETDVFSFSPGIKGTAKWVDAYTIEFRPAKPMPSGTRYKGVFKLGKIVEVSDELEEFPLEFNIVEQSFEVQYPIFEAIDRQTLVYQRVSGTLLTADVEDDKKVEQLLKASQQGRTFNIRWEHAADKRTHRYIVDSIIRRESASEVTISWDGSPIDVKLAGEHKVEIPALGDFKVMSITVQNDGEQYVSVYFSDPLLASQDLNGLLSFSSNAGAIELRYTISGNEIKCYPGARLVGTHTFTVSRGIRNVLSYPLPEGVQQNLDFADMHPAVSFTGKGVIMPASSKLMLPFEAVGLNAVDITIVKIYENNVAQFLQVNDLTGNRELVRVGRPVKKKTMRLDTDRLVDLRKPNQFAIDLDQLIRTEPGAVYNVKITFKKAYSLYRCDAASGSTTATTDDEMQSVDEENWDGMEERESSYWDYSEDYYSEDYNWNERDNPCHSSYYNPQRWASRNIMASDLGIIAKRGTTDAFTFAVTDLRTTKPLSGVTLDLLDFQQQVITTVTTDGEGMATIKPSRKPFLLVAKHKEQRGYLKLDDGSSLSLSHFDVSGDIVQKGLKGFIYGERGVWRPGDSIYLTFILEDRNKTLPPAHPVSFDLYDPNGVLYKRMVESRPVNGFYSFRTSTDQEAPTGTWLAKIKVGSVMFQKNLRIETVMPNRLKIEMGFAKPYLRKGDPISTTLKSRWLHGAIADGLDAKVDVTLTPAATTFARYSDYTFDDPARSFSAETQTVFEGKLSSNGEAQIRSDISVENRSAGMLTANFTTKVFEAGGNFSIDRFSIPFHPYESYVGIRLPKGDKTRGMLLTDTNHTVNIVAVSPDGNPVRGKKNVRVSLYKINWRWWWDRSEEDMSSYAENTEYQAQQESNIELVNGTGKWTLRVNYPEWGRYMLRVTDESGHSTGKIMYIDWPGWAGRAQRENAAEATMLTFTADKASYKVGEEAKLTIPTAKGGRALVSIESGTGVIETHWVEAEASQTRYAFKVTKSMLPNVFVHVTLVQPHAQTQNDLPIRLYGMIPVKVEDPATVLHPQITMAAQLRPDEASTIRISEATGKPMTYTLAIVDEGLLDLTRFKTPDPYAQFYAREALGVKTWDMYDFVMGAFGMQMNRILSIGGDEGINKKAGDKKANRFKPVVKFIGPFHLDGGKTVSHNITIENYVGSVRVMVVAGHDGAYGMAEKAVPVKKPLMVLATLPRVLGPGETVKLPVTVFAMEKNIRNATVRVEANPFVQVMDGASKTVQFARPGDEVVSFDIKVRSALGIAKVKVIATSGSESAEYEVELDVRNPNPFVTNVYEGVTEAGKSWSTSYTPVGMSGTNTTMLEVSSIPPLNLEKRLRYLVMYPHGCVEQTTSSVFPQLALNDLLDLNAGWKKEIERNVMAGIQKLRTFQTADGGMAYWPGEHASDEWSTSYAGHFMIEAQNFGYSLPVNFLPSWKKYQRSKALTWTSYEAHSNDVVQAYRLYTLALAKAPELGAMNRLKELKGLSATARWRLAAAYVLVGQKEVAQQLISGQPVTVSKYQELNLTYGSDTRDEAMILETLVLLGDKIRAGMVLQNVSKRLGSDEWMSTQTTAYALIAIARLTGKFADNKVLEFSYVINGAAQTYRSNAKIAQIPVKVNGRSQGTVQVTNKSGQLLYTRLINRGQPEIGEQAAAASNLAIEVAYKDMNGNTLNPASIQQGTDFKAEVTISNPGMLGDYDQMALSQIFPSGWEIHNTRMDIAVDENGNPLPSVYSTPRYQDIRDDRVYSYFNLPATRKVTYVVLLNASYLGKFYMPGVSCEAMYNGRISARTAGMWVEVVPRRSDEMARGK
jgi:uncharacterized protein YfaS (alpha-2-macroglobulin family)